MYARIYKHTYTYTQTHTNTHTLCHDHHLYQAEQVSPGPAHYNVDGTAMMGHRPISTLGGPSYTMGARTRPVGQSLQERDAAMVPGPGERVLV